jgi:hypothetical protein
MLFKEVIAIYCKKRVKQIHVGGMQLPSSTACGWSVYLPMNFKWLNPSCNKHKEGGGGVKTYLSL